jgi:hypothetical protein
MDTKDEHLHELACPVCAALLPLTIAPGEANASWDDAGLEIFCDGDSRTSSAAKQAGADKGIAEAPRIKSDRRASLRNDTQLSLRTPHPQLKAQQPSIMFSLQRIVISALLILSVTFMFFAQTTEAAKGPKITHKVR